MGLLQRLKYEAVFDLREAASFFRQAHNIGIVVGPLAEEAASHLEVVGLDGSGVTQECGAFDDVSQLAHVARPRVGREFLKGLSGDAVKGSSEFSPVFPQEVPGEKGNVLAAFAQRGQ